ncbi:MAG: 6-carboxytetrahydropterin synthase [Spirochaetota bacterium]
MYSAGVSRPLRARHYLNGDFGDESVPHSHPYRVEIVSRSRLLDENGFSTDIAALERVLEESLGEIDDVLLNDLAFFRDKQPSLENLALYLVRRIRTGLEALNKAPAEPLEIRIWENDSAWAGFAESE